MDHGKKRSVPDLQWTVFNSVSTRTRFRTRISRLVDSDSGSGAILF